MNSYGFDGEIPEGAEFGTFDEENGEWTGTFFFSTEDAEAAERELREDADFDHLHILPVVIEEWEEEEWEVR